MIENNEYYFMMSCICNNIRYYQQMIALSINYYQRRLFINLLNKEIMKFNYWNNHYPANQTIRFNEQRQFTIEELAQYDGSRGQPAYVAVNGIVYDVSLESTWGGGTHFGLYSGKDITEQFNACHKADTSVLKKLPRIGVLLN